MQQKYQHQQHFWGILWNRFEVYEFQATFQSDVPSHSSETTARGTETLLVDFDSGSPSIA